MKDKQTSVILVLVSGSFVLLFKSSSNNLKQGEDPYHR